MQSVVKSMVAGLLVAMITACVSSNEHKELQNRYDELENRLKGAQARNSEQEVLIAELERKLGDESAGKKSMANSVQLMKEALKEAAQRKAETEKRLDEFRKLISRFKTLTEAGELSIRMFDGKMVVALPSDVLFASGSAKLSPKGTETVQKVSKLLVSIPDKQFQIEGHTDNVPIRSSKFPSNWELANARSLNVLKTMLESGMPQDRISSAGFADTKPMESNDTTEGKAANRRIDIVVVPDLSQLPGYDELQNLSKTQE